MDYILKAREILSDCLFLPIEKISEDATINDIKPLNSLTFEMIVMEIEKAINKEVDPVDLLDIQSVKDLAKVLEKNSE